MKTLSWALLAISLGLFSGALFNTQPGVYVLGSICFFLYVLTDLQAYGETIADRPTPAEVAEQLLEALTLVDDDRTAAPKEST